MVILERTLAAIRTLTLAVAGLAVLTLLLIVCNLAQADPVDLSRFREPTLALWAALLLWAVARPQPRLGLARLRDTASSWLAHPRFFAWMSATMLALFFATSLTRHWAFETSSHDFSIFDDALALTMEGRLLHVPLWGRSFLTEHFSPILVLLAPLRWVFPTPYMLLLAYPIVLWSSVLPLRALLVRSGASVRLSNLVSLLYLNSIAMIATVEYTFHVEGLLPVVLLSLFLCHRLDRAKLYWALLVLALAIKEDVGIYLLGLAAYLGFAEHKWRRAALTAAACVMWVTIALQSLSVQSRAGESTYPFLYRWSQWGNGPVEIALGMLQQPASLVSALLSPAPILLVASLLWLPFLSRFGWLLIALPWALNATASGRQAEMNIYYGIPLLAFAAVAAVPGIESSAFRRVAAHRVGAWVAGIALILGVAHLRFPLIPRQRAEVVTAIEGLPIEGRFQALGCFFPLLGHRRDRDFLWFGDPIDGDFVLLRTDTDAWPFETEEMVSMTEALLRSGSYRRLVEIPGFEILRRQPAAGVSLPVSTPEYRSSGPRAREYSSPG